MHSHLHRTEHPTPSQYQVRSRRVEAQSTGIGVFEMDFYGLWIQRSVQVLFTLTQISMLKHSNQITTVHHMFEDAGMRTVHTFPCLLIVDSKTLYHEEVPGASALRCTEEDMGTISVGGLRYNSQETSKFRCRARRGKSSSRGYRYQVWGGVMVPE